MLKIQRPREVSQVSCFRGELEISDMVSIPVWAIKKTAEAKLPPLKKLSGSY